MASISIDLSGLSSLLKGVQNALVGTGNGGDLKKLLTDETRLLAREIGNVPSPRQRKKLERRIRRDIGRVFLAMPAKPFRGKQAAGDGITWLAAGPNFLLGVPDDRMLANRVSLAGGGAKSILYKSRGKSFTQQDRYLDVGRRGKQHVQIVNRFVIPRGAMSKLFAELKKRVGIRDASFAETAVKLGDKSLPQKTTNHFPTKHNTTRMGAINSASPEITFGSDAKGVAGLKEKVQRAVKTRERKMRYRLQMILSGYAKKFNGK